MATKSPTQFADAEQNVRDATAKAKAAHQDYLAAIKAMDEANTAHLNACEYERIAREAK